MERWLELEVEDSNVQWRITHARLLEALHAPWTFDFVALAFDDADQRLDVQGASLVTKKAKVRWRTTESEERELEGFVDQVDEVESGFRIAVRPRLALLKDGIDHQVFVGKDVVEITRQVLSEHGIKLEGAPMRSLPKRAHCVQSFESDLAFVSRILAEEGITWRLERADTLTLMDDNAQFPDGLTLPVRHHGGLLAGESVNHVRMQHVQAQEKVSLRDYDPTAPQADLSTSITAGKAPLERYEYPGGYRDPAVGRALAKIRLEEARARRRLLTGDSNSRRLSVGHVLTLEDSAREDANARWLLIEVASDWHDASTNEPNFVAHFRAVPAGETYRVRRTATARPGGVQTATVTGPGGAELDTESFGRVHALHRWDRRSPKTDKSSAWLRVVQPATSGGFLLPRVGWEALVGFTGISGDEPVILGRLYNGGALPPETLPGKKVVSAFGSSTTPGGGTANLVAMDDSSGNEGMSFVASKNMNDKTENDRNTSITASDTHNVGANRTLIVGQVHAISVAGAQTHSVGGSRTVNVDANKGISAASESVSVGGARLFTIGGDYGTSCSSLVRLVGAAKVETAIEHQSRAVSGAAVVLVGGTWKVVAGASASVSVAGASVESVGGSKSITTAKYALNVRGVMKETFASMKVTAGGDHIESFGAAAHYKVAGSAKLSGANVVVKAKSKLTIKAGGVTIEMTPGAVTVNGEFSGSVTSVDSGDQKYG